MLLYHNHTVRVTSELELIHFIFVLLKQFLPIVEDKSCLVLASPLLHTEMAARLVLLLSCLCVAATTAVNRGSIQVGREVASAWCKVLGVARWRDTARCGSSPPTGPTCRCRAMASPSTATPGCTSHPDPRTASTRMPTGRSLYAIPLSASSYKYEVF